MVNLMGRVSMASLECLFSIAEELLDKFKEEKKSNKERLDFYVRAMSSEQAMGWYLDVPVGGVFGSQRHAGTEGAKILPRCTADLTDVRMAGSTDSVMVSGEDFLLERCSTDLKRYPRPWHIENCEDRLDKESGRPYLIERIIGL